MENIYIQVFLLYTVCILFLSNIRIYLMNFILCVSHREELAVSAIKDGTGKVIFTLNPALFVYMLCYVC